MPFTASHLVSNTAQTFGIVLQPGVTTDEIDRAVHEMIIDNGAYPSPLRYGAHVAAISRLMRSGMHNCGAGMQIQQTLACLKQLLKQKRHRLVTSTHRTISSWRFLYHLTDSALV